MAARTRFNVKLWLRIHRQKLSVWAACISWLGVGAVYALISEKWSPTRAIYFAVSSLSTAGLQGIPLASKDWQYAFVGVWCLVGVPLFAAGVGELAGLFVREDCEVEARAQEWGSYGESDWDAAVGAPAPHRPDGRQPHRASSSSCPPLPSGAPRTTSSIASTTFPDHQRMMTMRSPEAKPQRTYITGTSTGRRLRLTSWRARQEAAC